MILFDLYCVYVQYKQGGKMSPFEWRELDAVNTRLESVIVSLVETYSLNFA
jgi:hypothetical protein